MAEYLSGVPNWFLVLGCLLCLGCLGFILNKLDKTLNRFEELFDKVFDRHERLEQRVCKLEGAHESIHGQYNMRTGFDRCTDGEIGI